MRNTVRVLLSLALPSLLVPFFLGCGEGKPVLSDQGREMQRPAQIRDNALALLRSEKPSNTTYADAIQQLNNYVEREKGLTERFRLSEAQRRHLLELLEGRPRFASKDRFGDEDPFSVPALLAEVERRFFTSVDVHHLNACFLLRDAARALESDMGPRPRDPGPDLEEYQLRLARHTFGWVVRPLQLQRPPDTSPWPPHEVLRRGTADADERARVFLALLEQLELDGGMVTRLVQAKSADGKTEQREAAWLPGVRIGRDIYLFEPGLGRPVPGPGGKPVATLRQVQENPELLKALPYAVPEHIPTAAQIKDARLLLIANLSALSPRMRELQAWLGEDNRVVLYQDLEQRLRVFQAADTGVQAVLWNHPLQPGYPTTLLLYHVLNPRLEPRFEPQWLEAKNDLQGTRHHVYVPGVVVPRERALPLWLLRLTYQIGPNQAVRPLRSFDLLFLRLRVDAGGVRDLLIRGRPDEASDTILKLEKEMEETLSNLRQRSSESTAPPEIQGDRFKPPHRLLQEDWAPRMYQVLQIPDPRQRQLLLEGFVRHQRVNLFQLCYDWAAPELLEHHAYFMALAKLESTIRYETRLAGRMGAVERSRLREMYDSAAFWFERYQALASTRQVKHWERGARELLALCQEGQARYGSGPAAAARPADRPALSPSAERPFLLSE